VRHADAQYEELHQQAHRSSPALRAIVEGCSPPGHDDLDTIPAVLDVIKGLRKETEAGVVLAQQKVELWRYNANLVFKVGENIVCFLLRVAFHADAFNANSNRTWTYSTKTDR